MTQFVISISSFVFRHLAASITSVVLPLVVWTVVYLLLFVIAILTNQPLGSLVALPLDSLIIFIVALIYTGFLLFPSIALAEWVSERLTAWKYLGQMVLATLILTLLTCSGMLVWQHFFANSPFNWVQWLRESVLIILFLLIPLGIYWWVCKVAQIGFAIPVWLVRRWRNRVV